MRLSGAHATAKVTSPAKVSMEDRKRSLALDQDDAVTPPSKRQANAANGAVSKMDLPEKEKEIEVCLVVTQNA